METFFGDIRHAWRLLHRSRAASLVIIATLGLAIGANTAIFSIVHAMLMTELPFRDPSRLVFVWGGVASSDRSQRGPLSGPELNDLRERSTLFAGFGAIWSNTAALDGDPEPEQLRIGFVTTDFFSVLGADAALGRVFAPGDSQPNAPGTILLTDGVWRRRYGGDPRVIGRQIRVNGAPTTIIGVMAADFRLLMPADAAAPDDLQAWLPFNWDVGSGLRGQRFLRVVGRMKPGVTIPQAAEQVDSIAAQISREFTAYGPAGRRFTTVALHADGVREIRGALLMLFAGVAILLLIACANIAGILVARAAARSGETALRLALGSGIGRLARQFLVEGLLLAGLGALAGLLVGSLSLRLMLALAPPSLGRLATTRMDATVLAFTTLVALLSGVLFSLAPLAAARRTNLAASLQSARGRLTGALRQRTRLALVAVQVALGVVLLVGAGLLVRAFAQILRVDPGFESQGSLTFRLALPGRYDTPAGINAFSRELQTRLLALPGATGAGAISHVPYDSLPNWGGPYRSDAMADGSIFPFADYRTVSPGLMEALGVRLIDGRFLTEADDEKGQPVVIVDDRLARRAWPGQRAIGQRLALDPFVRGQPTVWATVVGTVQHVRHRSLIDDLNDQVFLPQRQILRNPLAYVVHARGNPADLSGPIRGAVAALDPRLPIYDIRLLDDYTAGARGTRRFTMLLAAIFAGLALLLACIGITGVVAYSVARRRAEFGIRLALGARPAEIVRLATREVAQFSAVGLAIGLAAAGLIAPLLQGQLFGVRPLDPLSYLLAAVALGAAAALASWLPARQAARVNPLDALRAE